MPQIPSFIPGKNKEDQQMFVEWMIKWDNKAL